MNLSALAPGDRVYRYWDTGAMGMDMQPLTVVRVNRVTATVDTDQGCRFRIPPVDLVGFYRWDDS